MRNSVMRGGAPGSGRVFRLRLTEVAPRWIFGAKAGPCGLRSPPNYAGSRHGPKRFR